MNGTDLNRELLSYDEKICLAKLEESKAAERVRTLQFEKARFCLEAFLASLKTQPPEEPVKPIV